MENDLNKETKDDLKKSGKQHTTILKNKIEDDLKQKNKKMKTTSKKINLFLIPLTFRGQPFLGLAHLRRKNMVKIRK